MNEDIIKLREENERLSRMTETDWLTGLYNRGAIEEKVDQLLEEIKTGIMLVVDVDHFKMINDSYGHIAGDHVLQEIAKILRVMVLRKDIIGRISGDTFVIFIPVNRDKKFAEQRGKQIKERLTSVTVSEIMVELSVSVGWAAYEEADNYQSLFDRADQKLLREKRARNRRETEKFSVSSNGIEMDIKRIREELSEQDLIQGAYCQDYETFKGIYRFMERRLHRTKGSVYIILFTLTNEEGDFSSLSEREAEMIYLKEKIQECLRSADVFTQYSSGQFLVMVSDVTSELAEMIASRIQSAFYGNQKDVQEELLLHHCYPLTPVGPAVNVRKEII